MTSFFKPWFSAGLLLMAVGLGGCAIAQAQRSSSEGLMAVEPALRDATSGEPVTAELSPEPAAVKEAAIEATPSSNRRMAMNQRLAQAPLGRPESSDASGATTTVKIFSLDSQCEAFEGELVTLSEAEAVEKAVGAAIANSNNPDFSIASYRISQGRTKQEAIVDFRLAPEAERGFSSLSICEGQALFGSVRRTLLENGQFDITRVIFTAAGENLYL